MLYSVLRSDGQRFPPTRPPRHSTTRHLSKLPTNSITRTIDAEYNSGHCFLALTEERKRKRRQNQTRKTKQSKPPTPQHTTASKPFPARLNTTLHSSYHAPSSVEVGFRSDVVVARSPRNQYECHRKRSVVANVISLGREAACQYRI
jgi:hypothetical protein